MTLLWIYLPETNGHIFKENKPDIDNLQGEWLIWIYLFKTNWYILKRNKSDIYIYIYLIFKGHNSDMDRFI